jgi:HEAT repeat protein
MIKHLGAISLFAAIWTTAAWTQEPPAENQPPVVKEPLPAGEAGQAEFLIRSLANRDESIRREAFRRLQEDAQLAALPPLVEALRQGDQGTATRTALAIAARLDFLRRNPDPDGPRLVLLDEDRPHLAAVGELLDAPDVAHWRWYLAAWVLEQVDPAALKQHLPSLIADVREAQPMRQFGAVRALLLIGSEAGPEAKEALLAALALPSRPPFVGLYLRYNRTIENNRVAFTSDIAAGPAHAPQLHFYADDRLLILDALLAAGATFDEVGPALVELSRHEHEAVRLQAAGQLTRLGPPGLNPADAALAGLLVDRRSPLVRQLADEDQPTREQAVALVGSLGSDARRVVLPLAALLDSNEDRLRQSAAIALGKFGAAARDAAPALQRAIEAESLLADQQAVVSPEAKARAEERLRDMQAALESIESPFKDDPAGG